MVRLSLPFPCLFVLAFSSSEIVSIVSGRDGEKLIRTEGTSPVATRDGATRCAWPTTFTAAPATPAGSDFAAPSTSTYTQTLEARETKFHVSVVVREDGGTPCPLVGRRSAYYLRFARTGHV